MGKQGIYGLCEELRFAKPLLHYFLACCRSQGRSVFFSHKARKKSSCFS